MTLHPDAREWLSRATGIPAGEIALARMAGATSSSVYRIFPRGAPGRRYVLRIFDNREWLDEEPEAAAHEAAALIEAERAGFAAPRLVACAGTDAGFGAPVLVMTWVEGRVDLTPASFSEWLRGLAETLATIHRHDGAGFPWSFSSWVREETLAVPRWARSPAVWERAVAYWRRSRPAHHAVFIHRDYHPVNVLWSGTEVSAVVDWANACRGPGGADVAHCRVNLAVMYGPEAAEAFLEAYRETAGACAFDPYWDVDAVLDMCLPQPRYYEPWRLFGLGRIAQAEIERRVETLLAGALQRAGL